MNTSADAAPVLIACAGAPADASLLTADAIGFKAHNLLQMVQLGLPVPPAFVLPTSWCRKPEALRREHWQPGLLALEQASGARLGDARCPLLVSVRSGAPVSMPGMMDTLLNIGLADAAVPGLLRATGQPRLVWDAYRRLVAGYGELVLGVPASAFEADLEHIAAGRDERELDYAELRALTRAHQATCASEAGQPFPQDPWQQLEAAIRCVLTSWNADRAQGYRRLHGLSDAIGTAVIVQRMVFGNAGGTSGAGVGFTRHPSTGERRPWIDFLFNAQGEDVVAGRRSARGHDELAAVAPALWEELEAVIERLESGFADMQDFEFTVECGRLWMLQTRSGKRTAQAQARIALDLFDEGQIGRDEALRRTRGLDAQALATRELAAAAGRTPQPIGRAASAAHGIASGEIALDEARARARTAAGVPVVLVRPDADTADLGALEMSEGLLTARGARTSHAAVVARQLGKVCLVGCEELTIELEHRAVRIGTHLLDEGDVITLDGHRGDVYVGALRTVEVVPTELVQRLERLRASPAPCAEGSAAQAPVATWNGPAKRRPHGAA
jgi:pyruvate,orthophosphate dikinase